MEPSVVKIILGVIVGALLAAEILYGLSQDYLINIPPIWGNNHAKVKEKAKK